MVRKLGSIRSSRTMLSSSSPTSARRTHSSPLNSQVQSNDYASSGDIKKVFSKPRSFVSASAMVDQVRVPESARGAAVNIGRGSTTYMPWRSGNESAKETTPTSTLCARVIKSYRAFNNKELTVREGDIVRNVAEVGLKDWLKGSVGGMVGYFPASHVVMMIADSVKQGFGNSGSHSSTPNLSPSDQRRGSQTSVTSSSSNYNTRLPASSMPRNIMGGRSISVPGARTLPVAPSDSPLPYHLAQAAATTQQNTPGFDDRNDVSYSDMHAIEQAGRNSMSSVDDYESDEEIYEDADKFQECIYESFS